MTDLVDALLIKMKKGHETLKQSHIDAINTFDRHMTLRGLRESTRKHQIRILIIYAKFLEKSFTEATKKDVESFLSKSGGGNPKGSTINIYQALLKRFYKVITGEIPECVAWFQKSIYKTPRTKPSDLLSESEIKELANACVHERDKLIITLLWDSAIRVGELCNINIGDVINRIGQWYVTVDGKTGSRELELIVSAPQMIRYIDNHPFKNKMDAPLFLSFDHRNPMKRITTQGVYCTIQYMSKRAGIQKKITPHLIRKSRITDWVRKGLMEMDLRFLAGWTPESDMPATYVRLAPKQINEKRREVETGEKPKKIEHQKGVLLPIVCPRCSTINDSSNLYCDSCWIPLKKSSAKRDLQILNTFSSKYVERVLKIDIDDIINGYYTWKNHVNDMVTFYKAFESNPSIEINILRNKLGWNKPKFNRVIESLSAYRNVIVENDRIRIQKYYGDDGNEKSIFDNFVTIQKRYLIPR